MAYLRTCAHSAGVRCGMVFRESREAGPEGIGGGAFRAPAAVPLVRPWTQRSPTVPRNGPFCHESLPDPIVASRGSCLPPRSHYPARNCASPSISQVQGDSVHGKRQADPRGDHRPGLRGRVHSDLSELSRRRDRPRSAAATGRGSTSSATATKITDAVHRLSRAAQGPERRCGPHQLADPRPRLDVDRGPQGRQARGLHRADGHVDRRVPPDRRGPAQAAASLHDDGDGRLQPRVPVRQGAVRQGRARPAPVPPRQPPAGHGRLARLLAGPAADVVRHALRQPLPGASWASTPRASSATARAGSARS